jgi:GTP cyclohydrolase II
VLAAENADGGAAAGIAAWGPAGAGDHARRAETLKARAYDGDLARMIVPAGRRPRVDPRQWRIRPTI